MMHYNYPFQKISQYVATVALFWTGNRSLEEADDWSTNPSRDMEMEMSLEVEVAMWRDVLRMREEEAART
jgi:hypothetical protein